MSRGWHRTTHPVWVMLLERVGCWLKSLECVAATAPDPTTTGDGGVMSDGDTVVETGLTVPGQRPSTAENRARRPPTHLTPRERAGRGLAARIALPPGEQAELVLPADRPDPVSLMQEQARTRVTELVPVRHGRMMVSPFTFFRGNAKGMAIDLAATPVSGLAVQMCGDAHLSNFGMFASPERRLLFDVNDFDETLAGPWEWDVKRLAASMAVAGRDNGFSRKERRRSVLAAVRRYRDALTEFAGQSALDVWYARAEVDEVRQVMDSQLSVARRKTLDKTVAKARSSDRLKAFAKLTQMVDGEVRIKADPPLMVPIADLLPDAGRAELVDEMRGLLNRYRRTLANDRRALLDQFEFVDLARKVVGVGSVGTRCWIMLLRGRDDNDPLFLQVKEAESSVLKPHVPPAMRSRYNPKNEGERVVSGQRLMQAASDIFLGWEKVVGIDGTQRDFYIRQLRDMKGSVAVEGLDPDAMTVYGQLCGWTLARAHARSGDPIAISAYLGEDDTFPKAIAAFAELYADQTERDHAAFLAGIRDGRLTAESGL